MPRVIEFFLGEAHECKHFNVSEAILDMSGNDSGDSQPIRQPA